MKKKMLFIVNPASSGGRTLERFKNNSPFIDNSGIQYDVFYTKCQGDAIQIAKKATRSKDYRTIISVGGDGTANEVIGGMIKAKIPHDQMPDFTIFPSGTGSDTVRTLGIPKEITSFISMLKTHQSQIYDVGCATFTTIDDVKNNRFFINACDVGIGATVANTVNTMNKNTAQQTAKSKYFRSIIEQVFRFKAFDADYICDGHTYSIKNTVIVAVCNGMFFGGGVKISPLSKMNDGCFELFATENVSKPGLLGIVSKIYSGGHIGHPKVKFAHSKRFEIKLKQPQLLETDGEVQGVVKNVIFEVVPNAIKILT